MFRVPASLASPDSDVHACFAARLVAYSGAEAAGSVSGREDREAERLRDINQQLATIAEQVAGLHADRVEALRVLHESGWSLRRLAEASGLSHARVDQLTKT